MCCRRLIAGFLIVLALDGSAQAGRVYRCVGGDGVLTFQDRPCPSSQAQRIVQLPDIAPVAPTDAQETPVDAAAPAPAAAVSEPPPQRAAPPSFFLCSRYDGSRYLSDDGIGSRSAVPFGMLGGSGESLADAYGGKNGIGVSAPGLRTIPDIPAGQAPLAGAYVWVDDQCHHAGPQEACAYLRNQLDDLADKLRRAFSDTEAQLKQEQADLRQRMRGC